MNDLSPAGDWVRIVRICMTQFHGKGTLHQRLSDRPDERLRDRSVQPVIELDDPFQVTY